MKKSEVTFAVISVPLDYIMIILAALAAYFLRFGEFATEIRPVVFELPFRQYLSIVLLIALGWLLIFAIAGLYTIKYRKILDEIFKIFLACSTGILAIIVVMFFSRELFSSRFILLAAWFLSIVFVGFGRIIIRLIQRILLKKGIGSHKIIIIGDDKITEIIAAEIHRNPSSGYKIVDRFANFNEEIKNKILKTHEKNNIDEIIQTDSSISRSESVQMIDFCNEYNITFKYTAGPFEARVTNVEVGTIADVPIVEMKKTPLEGWGKVYKRIFDIIGSIVLIILTSPIMLIMAAAIKLDTTGPVFFKYKRVGEKRKLFTFVKFRSMKHGTHHLRYEEEFRKQAEDVRSGTPMIKLKKDPRITRVGRFIRRWSLDELAQLFLVLKGDMSLVGPRPHEKEEVARYEKHHKKVLDIKPGITGLAQISGRENLTFEDEVKLDTYYIENWSLKLDLQILFKTPWIVLKNKAI